MEEDGPLLHRQPGPLLERVHAGQKVQMLRAELAHELVAAKRLTWPERSPTDVLHLVVRHGQALRDRAVGGVLVRARSGPRAPKSEQQHSLAQLRLMLLR